MAATNGNGTGNGAPLVVFDFDKTIVDCDSDNWVVDALGATRRFDDLLRHLPWNHAIVSACMPLQWLHIPACSQDFTHR